MGEEVVIKRYQLKKGLKTSVRYRFRSSGARRFWAAAHAVKAAGIPTPEALGMLESYSKGLPVLSWVITRFLPNSTTLRSWSEAHFSRCTAEQKEQLIQSLAALLIRTYDAGLYHKDCKCENILLSEPVNLQNPALHLIDLECVQLHHGNPSRKQLIRNLVQLNGALGPEITTDYRQHFLQLLSTRYPCLQKIGTDRVIADWTARRLEKEKTYQCEIFSNS